MTKDKAFLESKEEIDGKIYEYYMNTGLTNIKLVKELELLCHNYLILKKEKNINLE